MIMNRAFIILLSFLSLFTGWTGCEKSHTTRTQITTLPSFMPLFKQPPAEFNTTPFWVWNDEVTLEKIDIQLQEFKSQNINSVMIHCRPGLVTEYLSEEWFELHEYALEKAKSMNMLLWLYDENGFPSGYAGGHVQREMPESANQAQGLSLEIKQSLDPEDLQSFLVLEKRDHAFGQVRDISESRKGEFYILEQVFPTAKERMGGYAYPDLLIPGVTETFIELTMPGYEKHLGSDFGSHIPGIFTDEPHIKAPDRKSIRWTPSLFTEFEARWGYRLEENLPSLFLDVGNYRRVRHDYYQILLEMFINRWSKPWHEYTEKHQLKWTGHYWEHGWPNPSHAGDVMALYVYHQIPGIDMLFNDQDARPDQFGNVMATREVRSIANQFGRQRTLSETYGAAGWDLDFESMKRLGDWQYATGINLMNQHLAYMTTRGSRKRDFPQSISWHAAWWPHYHHLTTHYNRLSVALSSGENLNPVLVIEPTTTTWMYFTPEQNQDYLGASGRTNAYAKEFKQFLGKLEELHIEYDLGSEMVMQDHADMNKGKIRIGQRTYDQIVLGPHVENLNSTTFHFLDQYINAGHSVYYAQKIPVFIDARKDPRIQKLVNDHPDRWIKIGENDQNLIRHLAPKDFQVTGDTKDVYHTRRTMKDGQIIFFANFSKKDAAEFTVTTFGESALLLDTHTGKEYLLPGEQHDKKITIEQTLAPGSSRLYYIHDSKLDAPSLPKTPGPLKTLAAKSPLEIYRRQDNVLVLEYCNLEVGEKTFSDLYYINAADSIFKTHGFAKSDINYNPWNFTVQYKTERLDQNQFGEKSGFEAVFPFTIGDSFIPDHVQIGVEFGRLYTIFLNGQKITLDPDLSFFDHSVDLYKVDGTLLKAGRNEIRLAIHPMNIFAELERVFILGDFSVEPKARGFEMVAPRPLSTGNWVGQGLPFYADGVSYAKTYDLIKSPQSAQIHLGEWQGSVASIRVNGEKAGIIGWQPYELDITEYLGQGDNHIEVVVYATPRNLLGPHHNHPRRGIATPWSWNYAPIQQPPGNDYTFVPYGLMEDFELRVSQ